MRFHYWKQLLAVLLLAAFLWIGLLTLAIDPLTLARSQNREMSTYMGEAAALLEKGVAGSGVEPDLLKEAKERVSAALVITSDQARTLSAIADSGHGLDAKDLLALFVAVLGGISTIILSWRKDVRDALAELDKIRKDEPRLVLPMKLP